jgi:hypothetical protein
LFFEKLKRIFSLILICLFGVRRLDAALRGTGLPAAGGLLACVHRLCFALACSSLVTDHWSLLLCHSEALARRGGRLGQRNALNSDEEPAVALSFRSVGFMPPSF